MNKHEDDGGPAFARAQGGGLAGQDGMSLRAWFAGQALSGMSMPPFRAKDVAEMCVELADALIAELAKDVTR